MPDWSLMNAEKKTHIVVERFSLEDIRYVIVAFIGSFQNPKAINFLLCVVPPHCFSSHTLINSTLRSNTSQSGSHIRYRTRMNGKNPLWLLLVAAVYYLWQRFFSMRIFVVEVTESREERSWAAEVIFLLVLIWGELELSSSSALKQWVTGTRK